MAITPRTILSRSSTFILFLISLFFVGGLIGLVFCASGDEAGDGAPAGWEAEDVHVYDSAGDVGATSRVGTADGDEHRSAGAAFDRRDHTCTLQEPADHWTEEHWMRHLDCMEARGESADARLEETEAAIDAVGLTIELAVEKADLFERTGEDEQIRVAFLEEAIDELGTGRGGLIHRLARALTWRADPDDLERIRRMQLLSRAWMSEECEVIQTDIWARYLLAHRFAERPSPAAFDGVRDAISAYRARDCDERRHTGKWDALAEVVGVGLAAEMVDGYEPRANLIRKVAESFEIRRVDRFCERAVPDHDGLRAQCEMRVNDELYLSNR